MAHDDRDAPTWLLEGAREVHKNRVFGVAERRMRRPAESDPSSFYVMTTASWVNVVALTADDQLVMVEQWRHGVQHPTLEIPGGVIDPGEDPFTAARRELAEETGYAAARWLDLGTIEPNPAIIDNRCHTYLALDAHLAGAQALDENEDCKVVLHPWADAGRLVAGGHITHALVVVALHYERLRRDGVLVARPL